MRDMPAIGAAPDPDRATRTIAGLRTAFARTLALLLSAVTLVVWARIAGLALPALGLDVEGTAGWAFRLALAFLLPLAVVGLWLSQPWGRVLWLASVAIHLVAMVGSGDLSGWALLAFVFHAVTLGLFVVIEAGVFADRRRLVRAAKRRTR